MPARTNEFQKLIYLMKHNLAEGATVTESKMLNDLISGDQVEVDVCVEGAIGDDQIKICIECRDRSRKADKNWVHEMKAKHDRLPTNVLVLASSRGFSKKALDLARSYGIQTVTLEEVENDNFPEMLAHQMSLWAKTISISAQRVAFVVEASNEWPEERVAVQRDHRIFDSDHVFQITADQLVGSLLNSSMARDYLLREGRSDHVWFRMEWGTLVAPPMHLEKIQPKMLRRITNVIIEGPCSLTVSGLRLRRGRIGSIQLAWGRTVMFGPDAMVVATRDERGVEKMSLNLSGASLASSVPSVDKTAEPGQTEYRH